MEELDIKELLYEFWKNKYFVILMTILGIVAGIFYSHFFVKPMYKSTAKLVLSNTTAITTTDITINQKLVSTYGEIMKSRSVASAVKEKLSLSMSEEQLIKNISVQAKNNTELLEISVSNEKPELAANIANTLSDVFIEKIKEVYKIENVAKLDEAVPSTVPYNVDFIKTEMVFTIGALFVACIIIFITVYFNNTFKNPEEIEKALGLPVLAVIPKLSKKE